MTKYVFVGDIHGKVEQVKRALEMEGTKIFVGDFMDSWDRKPYEHGECLELVCDAIERGEAEAIYGNHELSYLIPGRHRCSGYSGFREAIMQAHTKRVRSLFKSHILLTEGLLITHAGLTKQLWDQHKLTLETLDETLTKWWDNIDSPMHWIGRSRGGFAPYGGTFWCDFNDEFKPIPELSQIFGHTRGDSIRKKDNAYCIDCLDSKHSFLELEL